MAEGDVERHVGEGEFTGIALLELDVLDPSYFGVGPSPWQDIMLQVNDSDMALRDIFGKGY